MVVLSVLEIVDSVDETVTAELASDSVVKVEGIVFLVELIFSKVTIKVAEVLSDTEAGVVSIKRGTIDVVSIVFVVLKVVLILSVHDCLI